MQPRVLQLKVRSPNRGKARRLDQMRQAFTDAVRLHLQTAYALPRPSVPSLHAACYKQARKQFALPASTLQQARDKALSIYRSVEAKRKKGKRVSRPQIRRPLPLRLAAENLRFYPDRNVVRVSTPSGFLWLPVHVPDAWRELTALPNGVSEFVQRGQDWYLMLTVKTEDVPSQDGSHFGLDLGLANLAVLSGPGVVHFFDGKPLRYTRGRYHRYRQDLQRKRKTGMLKRSKGRESRWARCENHRVSRRIVDTVAAHGGVLHVEKLLGIRDRTKKTRKVNRMIHAWPFAELLSFVRYKAALAGVHVSYEDPRHTSQRCSKCGHTEAANRPRQADFRCKACGYRAHADLNASRNLAARGTCPSGVPGVTPGLSRERAGPLTGRGNCNL